MTDKVYITSQQTATFRCPKCQREKVADVSKYANFDKKIKVNVKCPCGLSFSAFLEKRKQYRKETNFPGSFIHLVDGQTVGRGLLTICDLSLTGMKLKVNAQHDFSIGDMLQVEFHLDDSKKTFINKKVIIRSVNHPFIGTEFPLTETQDKILGFYLLK